MLLSDDENNQELKMTSKIQTVFSFLFQLHECPSRWSLITCEHSFTVEKYTSQDLEMSVLMWSLITLQGYSLCKSGRMMTIGYSEAPDFVITDNHIIIPDYLCVFDGKEKVIREYLNIIPIYSGRMNAWSFDYIKQKWENLEHIKWQS